MCDIIASHTSHTTLAIVVVQELAEGCLGLWLMSVLNCIGVNRLLAVHHKDVNCLMYDKDQPQLCHHVG